MKVLKPVYYNEFSCTADKCKYDCCSFWSINVDKHTFVKYRKVKGEFGEELNDNVKRNRSCNSDYEYGKIKMKNEKCPFLNESGLCRVYINLGAEYLGETCTKYPRSIKIYNDMCQKNLHLSCPEVVKKIMEIKNPLEFMLEEENVKSENFIKCTGKLYDLIWKGRNFSIELAQFREIEIWKRLIFIKIASERLQELVINLNYEEADKTVDELVKTFTNVEVIKSFDKVGKAPKVKFAFINSIIEARENSPTSNQVFLELINEFQKYVCKKESDVNDEIINYLEDKETKFMEYFQDREYTLEHYIVLYLFENYFDSVIDKDVNKQAVKLILMYAIIKYLLIARWIKNNEILSEDDIIQVLYSVSRAVGHYRNFMEIMYNKIIDEGFDSLAYLAVLIK